MAMAATQAKYPATFRAVFRAVVFRAAVFRAALVMVFKARIFQSSFTSR